MFSSQQIGLGLVLRFKCCELSSKILKFPESNLGMYDYSNVLQGLISGMICAENF